jgi:hypothetical protein
MTIYALVQVYFSHTSAGATRSNCCTGFRQSAFTTFEAFFLSSTLSDGKKVPHNILITP